MISFLTFLTYTLIVGLLFFIISFSLGYPLSNVFSEINSNQLERFIISCSLGLLLIAFVSNLLLFLRVFALREVITTLLVTQWGILSVKALRESNSPDYHSFKYSWPSRNILVLLGLITLYIVILIRMLTSGPLYVASSDLQFHGILIQKISSTNGLVENWMPFRDVPVIYPQGTHAFASIIHFLLGKPEIGLVAYPFLIFTGILMILTIYAFTRAFFASESIALGTIFALVVLMVTTDFKELYLWGTIRWGGIAQLACFALLPFSLLISIRLKESRKKPLFIGIIAGLGSYVHLNFLAYFLAFLAFSSMAKIGTSLRNKSYCMAKKILTDFALITSVVILLSVPMILKPVLLVEQHPNSIPIDVSSDKDQPYLDRSLSAIEPVIIALIMNPFVWLSPFGLYLALRKMPYQGRELSSMFSAVLLIPLLLLGFAWVGYPLTFLAPYRMLALYIFPLGITIGISVDFIFSNTVREVRKQFVMKGIGTSFQRLAYALAFLFLALGSIFVTDNHQLEKLPPHVLEAIYYVGRNTDESAYILNDDAGHWIPALTGRRCTRAYSNSQLAFPYSNKLVALYNYLSESNNNYVENEVLEMIRELQITHVFIDPLQKFHYDVTIPLSRFENNSIFIEHYAEKSVRFYEIAS
ncbi:MAG: hypothetical protein ACE5OZ_10560 [Candidatus Heimdallarchaeota archaeon]